MSDDIPDDVMKAAMAVADKAFPPFKRIAFMNAGPLYEPIARAILVAKAEQKEADAKIAWLQSKQGATHEQIAAAIRSGA